MILGTGIDLAEVDRIQASIERYGDRFLHRIYTEKERAYVARKANKYERYAARFAAKEAGMKAIGTGWRGGVPSTLWASTTTPSDLETLGYEGGANTAGRSAVERPKPQWCSCLGDAAACGSDCSGPDGLCRGYTGRSPNRGEGEDRQ